MSFCTIEDHDLAVQKLADEVSRLYFQQVPFRINHGSTNSTRKRNPATPQLHIAHLNHILEIDQETNTALVEPNVALDSLVLETLKASLMPPVVMEFPGITVGGGFSGASGESTGWKEGLFDCSIEEIEIILGNGTVARAVKGGKNSDLFNGARCSLGTLGVVTLLKVRLIQAKDAVQLQYFRTSDAAETINRLTTLCEEDNPNIDFVEGILYSRTEGVIIIGRHTSTNTCRAEGVALQRFDRAIDPWFYMHAQAASDSHTELVPTQSYLFRHDRGAFWSGEVFLRYYGLPNNRLVRWLLNPILTARAIYKAMLATDSADGAIIQDLVLPVGSSEAFIEYVAGTLGVWPLWICPIRKKINDGDVVGWPFCKHSETPSSDIPKKSPSTVSNDRDELFLNFGVWGSTDPTPAAVRKTNRDLEAKLRDLRGMKVPYAANFYTEEEFWTLYDRDKYEKLRMKWHAEALPDMYEKVRRKHESKLEEENPELDEKALSRTERLLQTWPLGGLYQVFHVLFR